MQSLVLHPPSLTISQFGQPRFNQGPERLPLNRSWTTNARGCSPRAPITHQSMSGSPPAKPSEPSAEKPRGYPSSSVGAAERSIPALELSQIPVNEPPPRLGYNEQGPVYAGSPRPPGVLSCPPSAPDSAHPAGRSLAQKSTRRTKAHVASACVNCKKKHLGCDPARPCRRCVLAGKASTCVDVTHKKRGRPPLKAEDSSLRSYTTHLDNPTIPAEAQPTMPPRRTTMHRATSSRELRPMTDLQGLGDVSSGVRTPHRWSASVFPLTRPMDPSPTVPGGMIRRPFSSSGPASHSVPTNSHVSSAYMPMTGGFNPALKINTMSGGMERRFPTYGVPALPPPTSPPQHQPPPVSIPFLPYTETLGNPVRPPANDPRVSLSPRDPYNIESPVRLPPIHQATAGPQPPSHHVHRLSDPYPMNWSFPGREEAHHDPRALPPQRSAGPAFNYSIPHQRSSSITSATMDPIPRHLGPVELPSPIQITIGSSPSMTRADPPSTEAESHDNRPMKRRRMALDDMVNG
ncbi:uncharacterized protein N7479_005037 [Penicillium vulpinum]|uniref:Zn(2)-C6 fungal-type domain-containing protein n=1 Tax=Penicillium vulpinum TaxID=29845 RepID=A0A1V6RNL0_9EURO|nr:uncharacterized protein N7479_005037 [Penicillium vulpinum]KAJ5965161.1 hypothetical protein N7479_005037 [Penicillium vulpinum]OQE03019.1 hypothetical protein PENVUL_c036G00607 [Penicillium vulpinum]